MSSCPDEKPQNTNSSLIPPEEAEELIAEGYLKQLKIDPNLVEELIHIPYENISVSLSESTGVVTIDTTTSHNQSSYTFNNVFVIKMKNKRNIINFVKRKMYSAAQVQAMLKKASKLKSTKQVLAENGIDPSCIQITPRVKYGYNATNEHNVTFTKQKILSSWSVSGKIDCSKYAIITE